MNFNKIKNFVFYSFVGFFVSACAPVAVKEITQDKTGYLKSNFGKDKISGSVVSELAKDKVPSNSYGSFKVVSSVSFEDIKKEKTYSSIVDTVFGSGDGFFQQIREYSNNDIAYGSQYVASYGGIVPLKHQTVRYKQNIADFEIETKQLLSITKGILKPSENSEYSVEFSTGRAPQIANLQNVKLVCNTGRFYSATSVFQGFPGRAIDLRCERFYNGVKNSNEKFVFFESLGFSFKLEYRGSDKIEIYELKSISFN
ncbi:MAG TPA: hypothetical protein PLW86_05210 [Rhodocyclaceae bacterium]|nr:hypothetical protein [Rhodocyclaceae bacterium]